MAKDEASNSNDDPQDDLSSDANSESESESESDDSSASDSDSDIEGEKPAEKPEPPKKPPASEPKVLDEDDLSPEALLDRIKEAVFNPTNEMVDEEDDMVDEEDDFRYRPEEDFNFPPDPEKWREEDLPEYWADGPMEFTEPGWDPVWADEDDWEIMRDEVKEGRDPPIAPFYVPYRKYFPVIPEDDFDVSSPKAVIEELDRIEEFMKWVSYIFEDGSSYEGTVWDDYAHGKGVYVAENGLVRYEGEWLQNQMEGHGVVEVDIPDVEPVPGSKLEAEMRAEGRIISRDFMSPEDKRWLEMDIEDSVLLVGRRRVIPFYEREEWVKVFGQKPEKGRYRYAGQWKHGRMHGCGVYEVNEQMIFGRFYFGELLEDSTGCDSDVSTLHAGIAEVAAAKARMFVNKPDGMIREKRGPYGDPQHAYFYEEDDIWMAPGFINQFYEVPDYWKMYVQEVDKEREMWLNSFYKAPLRIPMPGELEYWWSRRDEEDDPEFVLLNKEPEPDPEDPSQLIYTEDPVIFHTRTGRIINYVEDEEHGVRMFWQPPLKDGEEVDPEKVEFLPLGYDEFFGKSEPVEKKSFLVSLMSAIENKINPLLDKIQKWAAEKKEDKEMSLELIESQLDFIEAEISLEEALEDAELEMKMRQKEEENKVITEDEDEFSSSTDVGKGAEVEARGQPVEEEEDEDEDEDDDEGAPMSFGTVSDGKSSGSANIDNNESKRGKAPFSSLSLSLPSSILFSVVPPKLQESLVSLRRRGCSGIEKKSSTSSHEARGFEEALHSVHFCRKINQRAILRASQKPQLRQKAKKNCSRVNNLFKSSAACAWRCPDIDLRFDAPGGPPSLGILSLHVPVSEAVNLELVF